MNLKQYLLSVILAALITGVICGFTGSQNANGSIIKMLCGLFMVIVLISPLATVDLHELPSFVERLYPDASPIAASGERSAHEELEKVIKANTEAYIVNKATAMGLQIGAEVTLNENDPPSPCKVVIKGVIPPYAKGVLQSVIADEIGIAKEDQQWIQER